MKLLFVSAGRRTYLVQYALDLKEQGYDVEVFVSDIELNAASFYVSENVHRVITPKVSDDEEGYAQALLDLCVEHGINVVVPLMDFVIPVLSHYKLMFESENIMVWTSSEEVVMNCLDKSLCEKFCADNQIPMPKSWPAVPTDLSVYPVIKKRIKGSGSVGQVILRSPTDDTDDKQSGIYLYQEFIGGQEYAMDIFNDFDGNYVHSCYRKKLLMRAGETDKASTLYSIEFEKLARKISESFRHVGNMDVDFMVTDAGDVLFLDFNPRFGGGYPFTHQSGMDYVKALVDISTGNKPEFPDRITSITGMKSLGLVYYKN